MGKANNIERLPMIDIRQVKEITADIVDNAKINRKEMSEKLNISYNCLSRWCNAEIDTHCIPLNKIKELSEITGDYRLQELLCEASGALFFRINSNSNDQIRKIHELIPALEMISRIFPAGIDDEVISTLGSIGTVINTAKGLIRAGKGK